MFKKIILCSLLSLLTISIFSQTKREQRIQERNHEMSLSLLSDDDPDFKNYSIPDSFKNAPAIIICQSLTYHYPRNSISNYSKEFHRKIVLNERTAVNQFSVLYLDLDLNSAGSNGDQIAIKIIKPGGKETIITGKDAIAVEEISVPRIYRSSWGGYNEKYFKMAIPGIEIGDTLEYSILANSNDGTNRSSVGSYSKFYYFLNHEYPLLNQKVVVHLSRNLYLSYKPVFCGINYRNEAANSRDENKFVFTDSMRAATVDERWLFDGRELPHFKFQVAFGGHGLNDDESRIFMPNDPDTPKTSITKSEIQAKIQRLTNISSAFSGLKPSQIKTIFEKFDNLRKIENMDEKLEMVYRRVRERHSLSFGKWNDEFFVTLMYNVLLDMGIQTQIVAVPSRRQCTLENILLADEIVYCLKYHERFIFPLASYSNIYESDSRFEGQRGYVASFDSYGRTVTSLDEVTIPISKYDQNVESHVFHLSFEGDQFESLKVLDSAYYGGLVKEDYHTYTNELGQLGIDEDRHLKDQTSLKEVAIRDSTWDWVDSSEVQGARRITKQDIINQIKKEYLFFFPQFDSLYGLNHFQTGTIIGRPSIARASLFSLKNLTQKVANNYTIEIGQVIGSQVDIKQEDKLRHHNIWFDFARQLDNVIYVKIPEGYKADGLENFNFNIDNTCGKFISKATMENNQVKIVTQKIYKSNYLNASEWPNLVSMLDAAYNFTQKKIVLVKL